MAYRIVRPDAKFLSKAGYESVSHIPFLIRSDGSYPALPNRYIRARSLCEWPLQMGTLAEPATPQRAFQTVQSCVALARRVTEFLSWAERSGIELADLSYADLLRWQSGLLDGSKSTKRKGVTSGTANLYVNEGCYYLTWLSLVPKTDHGAAMRPPFIVVAESRSSHKEGRRRGPEQKRIGALEATAKRELALPNPSEVARWLVLVRSRSPVKALMAEVILDSGMRISEVNSMRFDTLPNRDHWRAVDNRVFFEIKHGVKGKKITPTSDIAQRGRPISLSVDLATRVDDYREHNRELQIRRWIREPKDRGGQARRAGDKPKRLWLSEATNQPFANEQLRALWRNTAGAMSNWTPHAGRKYFAVEWLVTSAKQLIACRDAKVSITWLDSVMRNQIDTFLRPALGHLSIDTTNVYIRAAMFRLGDILQSNVLKYQDGQDNP